MKFNKIAILLLSADLLTTTSCDFMDCDESDNYTLQEIQGSYNRVKQFVTSIYGYLPSDFCNTHGAMLDATTDDAIHVYESSAYSVLSTAHGRLTIPSTTSLNTITMPFTMPTTI